MLGLEVNHYITERIRNIPKPSARVYHLDGRITDEWPWTDNIIFRDLPCWQETHQWVWQQEIKGLPWSTGQSQIRWLMCNTDWQGLPWSTRQSLIWWLLCKTDTKWQSTTVNKAITDIMSDMLHWLTCKMALWLEGHYRVTMEHWNRRVDDWMMNQKWVIMKVFWAPTRKAKQVQVDIDKAI